MRESPRDAIRQMLKTFGIQADEAITAHLAQDLNTTEIRLKISLTDLTDYSEGAPKAPLKLEIEGSVPTGN